MATQTIEFPSSSGLTLTAKLSALGSDVITSSVTATEATNRKGTYTAVFTDVAAAEYRLNVIDSNSIPSYSGFVELTLTTATFQVQDNPKTTQTTLVAGQIVFKKNTAYTGFTFPMFDSNGNLKSGLTITLTRSIDGAAFGAATNSPAEIGVSGVYSYNFSAADLNGNTITYLPTATGAVAMPFTIVTQP